MSAELANKINVLCQKVKRLSKRTSTIASEVEDKGYIFATLAQLGDDGNPKEVDNNGIVPYDTTISSNLFTLMGTGAVTVLTSGAHRITFVIHPDLSINRDILSFAVAVNGTTVSGTQTGAGSQVTPSADSSLSPIVNTVILDLNAGDVVGIINLSGLIVGLPFTFTSTSSASFTIYSNISIEKL